MKFLLFLLHLLPVAAVWEDAKRNGGKVLICPDGFRYTINKKKLKKTFLHCNKKKLGCTATATVDRDSDMLIDIRQLILILIIIIIIIFLTLLL